MCLVFDATSLKMEFITYGHLVIIPSHVSRANSSQPTEQFEQINISILFESFFFQTTCQLGWHTEWPCILGAECCILPWWHSLCLQVRRSFRFLKRLPGEGSLLVMYLNTERVHSMTFNIGAGEMTQQFKSADPPAFGFQLATIWNSSSKGSHALFWPTNIHSDKIRKEN